MSLEFIQNEFFFIETRFHVNRQNLFTVCFTVKCPFRAWDNRGTHVVCTWSVAQMGCYPSSKRNLSWNTDVFNL